MTPKYSEGLAQAGTMKGASIYQDALKSFFCVTLYRIVIAPPLNWRTSQSLIIFNVVFCPILPPFHSYYLIPFIIWRRSFPYRRQCIRCARRNSWHWSGVIDICVLRVCGVWWRESHCIDPRGSWSCSRPYIRSSNLCFFNIPSGQIRQTPGQAPIKLWIVSAVFIDSKQHWFFCCSNRKQCDTLLNKF